MTPTDAWLVAALVVTGFFFVIDWLVAWRSTREASKKPWNNVLVLAASRSVGIAVATTIGAVLVIGAVVFAKTGARIIPVPWSAVGLAVAFMSISIPNIYGVLRVFTDGDEE